MTTDVSSEDDAGGFDFGILKPFKTVFDKITKGTAGANEYAAATGILGMLLPGMLKTKTAGWKGSIDMNKPFTRTPIAQPAYTPYAGGAAPVMGRQFFTTYYGAPPAETPATGGTTGTDNRESTDAAAGGLMGLARGGRTRRAPPPRYLRGETDGMADKIPSSIDGRQPAKLSHGEFVIPADVVSHLGNGNSDAGAKVLYKMMDRVRQARTGTKKQGRKINPAKFTPGGIASGYAGGGAVAFSAGSLVAGAPSIVTTGGTGSTGTTADSSDDLGTTRESNIASWAGPYVGEMLSRTAALTASPYQSYQGPMVAGTSPLQSKVFEGLGKVDFPGQIGQTFSSAGAYQLPTMTATGATQPAATGPTGVAAQYMNPYLQAVLNPQLEEMRRQAEISSKNLGAKFGGAGGAGAFSAMGGGRHAIESSELQRNLMQEQNKAIGTGYANAYDRALAQFNTEQQQARSLADMISGAGQQQRDIEQQGITALQKQYETELLDPFTKLRFQKEMLQGLPVATESTTPNTNLLGQIKGGLGDIQGLLDILGIK